MRKTCRWIGCAALLCCTAVEFSGCSSKSIVSSLRIPGMRDRSHSVAGKSPKVDAKAAEDLLAEAREYEKSGDFPKATKAYREYLNAGGAPLEQMDRGDEERVARVPRRSAERMVSDKHEDEGLEVESPPPVRKATKAKVSQSDRTTMMKAPETVADPWAGESDEPAISDARDSERVEPEADTAQNEPVENDKAELTAHAASRPAAVVSTEDVENLLDIEDAPIDWGDEPEASELASNDEAVNASLGPEDIVESETPEEDEAKFAAREPDETARTAETNDGLMSNEEGESSGSSRIAATETESTNEESDDGFAAPILEGVATGWDHADEEHADEEDGEEIAPSSVSTIAMMCRQCEPLVYAQVMKLESPDEDVRKEGLTHLADMGSSAHAASPAVRILLQDSDPLVQAHAAWALWRMDNDPWESVGALCPLLDHSNAEVVEMACYILGDIGAPAESGVAALELLRDHADGSTCIHAAEALVRIRGVDEESLNVLVQGMKSRDGEVRWIAAVALGRCQGEQAPVAVAALTEGLRDIDAEVRGAAALSLGGLGSDATVATSELQRVAHSDDAQVREAAMAALACLQQEE